MLLADYANTFYKNDNLINNLMFKINKELKTFENV